MDERKNASILFEHLEGTNARHCNRKFADKAISRVNALQSMPPETRGCIALVSALKVWRLSLVVGSVTAKASTKMPASLNKRKTDSVTVVRWAEKVYTLTFVNMHL